MRSFSANYFHEDLIFTIRENKRIQAFVSIFISYIVGGFRRLNQENIFNFRTTN